MTTDLLYRWYREVWRVDYEYRASAGERPTPVCVVARELRSGRLIRSWADQFINHSSPPYPTGPDVLFVAYYAPAELSCHLAVGWPLPARVLDLYAEFKCLTSGLPTPHVGRESGAHPGATAVIAGTRPSRPGRVLERPAAAALADRRVEAAG